MTRVPRLLVAAGALLLGLMFLAPVWSIRLVAPQYPEGLGLVIRLNTITGFKENDLQSINSLNHYIGMRAIEPAAIPELKYMPWIVAGLMVAGLAAAAIGRRKLVMGWVGALMLIGAVGMYDFWRWGYDYGHNLDAEQAVIVVPGMTYQPPLIGTKQLLNFRATSLPHVGAVAAGLAVLLGISALAISGRGRARGATVALAMSAAAAGCATATPHIEFGLDACAECRMVVGDRRFGAQLISNAGKVTTFDSIACLRAYVTRTGAAGERWVVDAHQQGALVREDAARILADGALRPPMGALYAIAR